MQLCSLRIEVADSPGRLAAAVAVVAELGGNIVGLDVHGAGVDRVVDEVVVGFTRQLDLPAVAAALDAAGVPVVHLRPADPHELSDPAVRCLDAAGALCAGSGSPLARLAAAAAAMLRADVSWVVGPGAPAVGVCGKAAADGSPHQAREHLKRLPARDGAWVLAVPVVVAGRTLVVGVARTEPAFTFTESARLQALARLVRAEVVELADGGAIEIRPLTPADRAAVDRMHRRCSTETVYRRYLRGMAPDTGPVLDRLVVGAGEGRLAFGAFLGTEVAGAVHAAVGPECEIAFLVEDGHQRRGIGTALVRRAVESVASAGASRLVALALPDTRGTPALLRRAGLDVSTAVDDGLLRYEADLRLRWEPRSYGGDEQATEPSTGRDAGVGGLAPLAPEFTRQVNASSTAAKS